jgi:hypothetical protein
MVIRLVVLIVPALGKQPRQPDGLWPGPGERKDRQHPRIR